MALTNRVFFERIVARLGRDLPDGLNGFRASPSGHLLKVSFGGERIHYEVSPDRQRGHIEVGLHFEDGPVSTAAYLRYFDARIVELKDALGADVHLERWTASWGHIFYVLPLEQFDDRTAETTASHLARLIRVLQPLVEAAAVPAERAAERAAPGRPFRPARRVGARR